ncbi:MAG TPA: YdbL family protein [Methylophilaceae bacterium]|nr:YdbL family protein [Methylophilaceae bacterium]
MKQRLFSIYLLLVALLAAPLAFGAADIEINTPAIATIKANMKAQHQQLKPFYESGAIGLTRDGLIGVRDANLVPLSQRQNLNSLVAAQNKDRNALYKEIAVANGHPEWENEIRHTFAQRWIDKAQGGWWVQDASGAWVKK